MLCLCIWPINLSAQLAFIYTILRLRALSVKKLWSSIFAQTNGLFLVNSMPFREFSYLFFPSITYKYNFFLSCVVQYLERHRTKAKTFRNLPNKKITFSVLCFFWHFGRTYRQRFLGNAEVMGCEKIRGLCRNVKEIWLVRVTERGRGDRTCSWSMGAENSACPEPFQSLSI